jgi:hypothetical protein
LFGIASRLAEKNMSDAPDADACMTFSDYILEECVTPTSTFPPSLWSSPPENNAKRTNNGTESFHSHYNGQFYARHPLSRKKQLRHIIDIF